LHPSTPRRWAEQGALPAVRWLDGRWRFKLVDLDELKRQLEPLGWPRAAQDPVTEQPAAAADEAAS
jgi:hypothetical protein